MSEKTSGKLFVGTFRRFPTGTKAVPSGAPKAISGAFALCTHRAPTATVALSKRNKSGFAGIKKQARPFYFIDWMA
jgi:hypothetical protein